MRLSFASLTTTNSYFRYCFFRKMATTIASFSKLEAIRKIEAKVQDGWKKSKVFESDAPGDTTLCDENEKYFVTFPFPYMNGKLHLGHSFTLSKAEFAVGYERLKGKKCLFPFGFHCTGMPIKACADKLKKEMDDYGYPPKFPEDQINEAAKSTNLKSKIAAKKENAFYQWEIMKMLNIDDEEIKKFADPTYWLKYFPPIAIKDLVSLGVKVDWRRSFITTDGNPFFDSFIKWHFEKLHKGNKIKFGKRHTIYSIENDQPCMDHDRQSGEGIGPQEYTLIKMKLMKPYPEKLRALEDQEVFLVAATLRPETMYGQTNCWVHPDIEYIAFQVQSGEVFVSTKQAALNMAYQDITTSNGRIDIVAKVTGKDLLGTPLKAPLTSYDTVYALPMLTIKDNKGTGIVTSVPSDAPDDYAALRDLQNKEAFRSKYSITGSMVLPFKPVPIIEVPEMGNLCAVKACEEFKVTSQNDTAQLHLAKEKSYKKAFYDGVMLVGEFKGEKVSQAKKKIQAAMVKKNEAVLYQEPEQTVISRSGDKCVVALCDQWYIDYGEENWKKEAAECLKHLNTYGIETRRSFEYTLDWLHEHACSRSYGLGSKIPWDQQYVIESLSDSTIYMAYYTVCHLLQGGILDGSQLGKHGIKAEQLTIEVWDYIFLGEQMPAGCEIPEEALRELRREFTYWYPLDLRVSGKDLVPNHLTYFMYNHVAIWPEPTRESSTKENRCWWPKAVRSNGHLLLNSEKMSKSTGNFLNISQAVERFSADGTRLALADAGDTLEDANFVYDMADAGLLRLYSQIEWTKEMLANKAEMRCNPPSEYTPLDKAFESEINKAIELTDGNYSNMNFRAAVKSGFFDLQSARDRYRDLTAVSTGMNRDLVLKFIKVQALLLSPVCPHVCEHLWQILGEAGYIVQARWPSKIGDGVINELAIEEIQYLVKITHEFRIRLKKMISVKGKDKDDYQKPSFGVIYVARSYPEWQQIVFKKLQSLYDAETNTLPPNNDIIPAMKTEEKLLKVFKKVMPFVQHIKEMLLDKRYEALQDSVRVDEKRVLLNHVTYMTKALELEEIWVEDLEKATDKKVHEECTPGKPMSVFTSNSPKPFQNVTVTNSENNSVYSVPVYDGDMLQSVENRISRAAGILGKKSVKLNISSVEKETDTSATASSRLFALNDGKLLYGTREITSQLLCTFD